MCENREIALIWCSEQISFVTELEWLGLSVLRLYLQQLCLQPMVLSSGIRLVNLGYKTINICSNQWKTRNTSLLMTNRQGSSFNFPTGKNILFCRYFNSITLLCYNEFSLILPCNMLSSLSSLWGRISDNIHEPGPSLVYGVRTDLHSSYIILAMNVEVPFFIELKILLILVMFVALISYITNWSLLVGYMTCGLCWSSDNLMGVEGREEMCGIRKYVGRSEHQRSVNHTFLVQTVAQPLMNISRRSVI